MIKVKDLYYRTNRDGVFCRSIWNAVWTCKGPNCKYQTCQIGETKEKDGRNKTKY